ncbi:hypothetical protein [Fibrella forsythiae]|uniref:DUF4393 domain-containing protein n=1 Tax=Fibrella forsythiae TaxID=2817061 RepID=A0ABS3JAE6_9BACT|nr:hypothetical protein [Fibrella forsythiae]MBO0946971.1 hypothetical protein [Fibrella forsythiae]
MKKILAPHEKSTTDSAVDTAKDLFEVMIDSIMTDGILKDLPVIGTAIGFIRTGMNIRDYTFVRKLSLFLMSCDTISEEKRKEYNDKINEEPDFREKVGEQLILFVEKIDTIEKTTLLARAFSAFLKSEIVYTEFLDLGILVNALNHSAVKDMCRILYAASNIRFDKLSTYSPLEIIGILQRDGLLVSQIQSVYKEEESRTGRPGAMKREIKNITLYKATRLAVLFITYVVPDIYDSVKTEITLRNETQPGFIGEGEKYLKDPYLERGFDLAAEFKFTDES